MQLLYIILRAYSDSITYTGTVRGAYTATEQWHFSLQSDFMLSSFGKILSDFWDEPYLVVN